MNCNYSVDHGEPQRYVSAGIFLSRIGVPAAGIGLIAGLFLAPLCNMAQETNALVSTNIQDRVQLAIDNSERMYRYDFDVIVASKQMNTVIEEKVTKGSPLPVAINQLTLMYRSGNGNFKATIQGLPPEFRMQVEPALNEMIGKSELGSLWNKTTKSFLSLAREEIAKGGQVEIVKETKEQLVVAVEKLDLPFHKNVHLNAIRLIIDKKNTLVTGARLYLTEAKDLTVMIEYDFLKMDGEDKPLPVWSRIQVEQNSWMGTLFGFIGWPNKMLVNYSDYNFHKPTK
ncbi:MAG: hypothetical protein A2283_12065 [Lentisphaerae bacterium RIFOXYA12_FULL_48_11]|nr:MAG: hypothetical protein A2283_12065 [Lentisphaerae bacterium RIFOXYA12_FULL_48_11]